MGWFSDLFGSSKDTSTTKTGDPVAINAWALSSPLYQSVLNNGQGFLNSVFANPAYAGKTVADLNGFQTSTGKQAGDFANNTNGYSYNLLSAGLPNLNAGMYYGAHANDILDRASKDPTNSILDSAGMYANNPYVNGMIDAANRDVARSLAEQQLPGINRAAAGTGNLNSSRAGVESAIAQRGAADRMADTASNIRSQFFGKGLDMAQNQWNNNISNMLNANTQLLNAGKQGIENFAAGQNFAGGNFNLGQQAGNVFQNQDQNVLNANKTYFDESQANILNALKALGGITALGTGWNSGGGSTNTEQTDTASPASVIGSILGGFI